MLKKRSKHTEKRMVSWQSLYLSCAETAPVIQSLRDTLTALDYTLYDPFGLIPGKAYPQAVRLFVAPAKDGWVQVIGAPDSRQLSEVSKVGLCLLLALDGADSRVEVYADGAQVAAESALSPHLRAGATEEKLRRVLSSPEFGGGREGVTADSIPLDILPEDVQAMAKGVSAKQAQKMFSRFSKRLLGDDQRQAAQEMLAGNTRDWDSAGGKRIRALADLLTLPSDWREPDFVTLRDAYQLHNRKRRNPNAALYPGDAEAMSKIPHALDFTPVYAGKMG
jgi:hypothetical protein